MRLVYRGASYETNAPQVEIEDTGLTGNYRGHELHFHQAKRQKARQVGVELHYRGAVYTSTAPSEIIK